MTILTKTQIIQLFEDGDVPSGQDFSNWIQSCITQAETSAQGFPGEFNASVVSAGAIRTPAQTVTTLTIAGRSQNTLATVSGNGTAQGSAAVLSNTISLLTPTSADQAYALPGGYAGYTQMLRNKVAVTALVFPPSGGSINGAVANASYSLPGSARMMVVHEGSAAFSTWRCTE